MTDYKELVKSLRCKRDFVKAFEEMRDGAKMEEKC